jgi:endonuclease
MPVTVQQREAILALLSEGLDNKQIADQVGVTPGTVVSVKANLTMGKYPAYEGALSAEAEIAEIADAGDVKFSLERDLQMALRRTIEQLDPSLTIIDGDREQKVASGRIDITARDSDGAIVVIELKAGTADREAIGQVLGYMGDLMDDITPVKGILVAREFQPRAVSAARAVPNLRIVQYGFRFNFETVTGAVS